MNIQSVTLTEPTRSIVKLQIDAAFAAVPSNAQTRENYAGLCKAWLDKLTNN